MVGRQIKNMKTGARDGCSRESTFQRLIEVKTVGLHVLVDAHLGHVDEVFDAKRLLEACGR